MAQHRTSPPRAGPWEHPQLSADEPQGWLIEGSLPSITDKIFWRLRDSLLRPRIIRLARSTLREFDPDHDWRCWRYLGSGGFGAAAVFTQTDDAAKVVDEIVVKEVTVLNDSIRSQRVLESNRYIATEALVHNRLGNHHSDNLIHLRDYKAIFPNLPVLNPNGQRTPGPIPSAFMRFYLEYAPYGTLTNLLAKYKAFNRYLPETFLWHLFNSLAKAVLTLEQNGPNENPHFVAHFDIKPDNIFLGYETTKGKDPELTGGIHGDGVKYPSVKLGDFGLAMWVVDSKPIPMGELGRRGTPCFYSPEIVATDEGGQYGGDWDPPANRPDDNLTRKVNVWGIGKVIAKDRLQHETNGRMPLSDYATRPFYQDLLHSSSPYTNDLSDIIAECMHAEPTRRPTAQELYDLTSFQINRREASPEAALPFSVRGRKLYYRGNEINNMPFNEKNCGKTLEPEEYFDLVDPAANDPDDPELQVYPEQIWEGHTGEELQRSLRGLYQTVKNRNTKELRFWRYILQNKQRLDLRLQPNSIRVIDDLDGELTYTGKAGEDFFIDESKRLYGRPPKHRDSDTSTIDDDNDGGGGDGGGGGGDGGDDDDDDGDGGDGGPGDGLEGRGADVQAGTQPQQAVGNEQQAPQQSTRKPKRKRAADFFTPPKADPRGAQTVMASMFPGVDLSQPTRQPSKDDLDNHMQYGPSKRPRLSQVTDTEVQVRAENLGGPILPQTGVKSAGKKAHASKAVAQGKPAAQKSSSKEPQIDAEYVDMLAMADDADEMN